MVQAAEAVKTTVVVKTRAEDIAETITEEAATAPTEEEEEAREAASRGAAAAAAEAITVVAAATVADAEVVAMEAVATAGVVGVTTVTAMVTVMFTKRNPTTIKRSKIRIKKSGKISSMKTGERENERIDGERNGK